MKKLKYEKPMSVNAGYIAPVTGENSCLEGNGAGGACSGGDDPYYIPYCPKGNIATGNCEANGLDAGTGCFDGNAAPGRCYAGGNTE